MLSFFVTLGVRFGFVRVVTHFGDGYQVSDQRIVTTNLVQVIVEFFVVLCGHRLDVSNHVNSCVFRCLYYQFFYVCVDIQQEWQLCQGQRLMCLNQF